MKNGFSLAEFRRYSGFFSQRKKYFPPSDLARFVQGKSTATNQLEMNATTIVRQYESYIASALINST
jgi:hypothetical protein